MTPDTRPAVAALAALFATAASPATAQDINEGWRISVTPFLWPTTFEADLGGRPTGNTHHVKLNFDDILDHLALAALGKAEVQHDRVGVIGDLVYLKLEADRTIDPQRPILPDVGVNVDVSTTFLTGAGFYRAYQTNQLNVDLLAGIRYTRSKIDLNAPGGGRDQAKSWLDPIVGVRATQRLAPKVSLTGYGDIGLWGASDTNWQLQAHLTYQWNSHLFFHGGYRFYKVDYDKDLFTYDAETSGPIVGATYRF